MSGNKQARFRYQRACVLPAETFKKSGNELNGLIPMEERKLPLVKVNNLSAIADGVPRKRGARRRLVIRCTLSSIRING